MRRFIVGFGTGLLSSVALIVSASNVDPNSLTSFSNGATLNAQDLINNNTALKTAIDDNFQLIQQLQGTAATINFNEYLLSDTYNHKVFAVSDLGSAGCDVVRDYTRTTTGSDVEIVRTQTRASTDPNLNCSPTPYAQVFLKTPTSYLHTKNINLYYDTSGNSSPYTYQFEDPIPVFQTGMRIGASSGGASRSLADPSGIFQTVVDVYQLLAILPTVNVNLVTGGKQPYSDCISVLETHSNGQNMSYYCKQYGLVKRFISGGTGSTIWELQSVSVVN